MKTMICTVCGHSIRLMERVESLGRYVATEQCVCGNIEKGATYSYNLLSDSYEEWINGYKPDKPFLVLDTKEAVPERLDIQTVPAAKDQGSLADGFENELQVVMDKYCGQGMTIGSALGAMQNRMFHLMLNIHLSTIVDVVKRNLK